MSENARLVSIKCGQAIGPMINRPSVEYTGHGNLLVFDGWAGRWFRANEKWVRDGVEKFIADYKGDESGGDWVNYNDLYRNWGLEVVDCGAKFGYSPDEEYKQELNFEFTMCGPGTNLYEKMGEKVLLVEPSWDSMPWEGYMEV